MTLWLAILVYSNIFDKREIQGASAMYVWMNKTLDELRSPCNKGRRRTQYPIIASEEPRLSEAEEISLRLGR